jgi:hypothetical protein
MSNYQQGIYECCNPKKYRGSSKPRYRSGWELVFMRMCDNHPNILYWNSVPDFFIVYQDKNGKQHAELIEIKPYNQTSIENAKSKKDKFASVVNLAKWQAAQAWSKQNGVRFRVITEKDIFNKPQTKK